METDLPLPASPTSRLRVGFVLAPSFTLSPCPLFVDTLRLAADQGDRACRMHAAWVVTASRSGLIGSSCGIEAAPTGSGSR